MVTSPKKSPDILYKLTVTGGGCAGGGGGATAGGGGGSAPAGGTGGAGATASGGTEVQQPAFNIVGQGGTNQIASALGEQQQTPIQAFVVSQDVTTAQSLENGIIQGATLGD